ncbi:MAG TPA: cobalamin B12-binding domain-containing protein [Desulfarculaceae bacterium]|nr:cobalamin B12-binding domain-containing protein [Desulfarculaceae bacterium]
MNKNIRVLIGKPGLDGHDKGAKVICHALREAGMEVIYTGLHRSIEQIVGSAVEEDVDAIGLSILSGAHLHYADKLISALQQVDAADITTFIGGVIPDRDIDKLKTLGVKGVFPGGLPLSATVNFLQNLTGDK